eukprot:m.137087 g.137087  ORF g.137087 m.137087 type:complete len:128 (-) comp9559_c2_seq2:505-888(-)
MASSAVSIGPPLPSLSHTHGSSSQGVSWTAVPWRASILIVVCRMVLVPAIGLGAVVLLRLAFPDFPPSMYLAMLMVTATPTANNIMVMAELAGENKQALSTCISLQYLAAPLVLTAAMFSFVAVVQS